ncbi:hypothetical protein WDW86_14610 [Bdellovibrionota bacterium FG-2]
MLTRQFLFVIPFLLVALVSTSESYAFGRKKPKPQPGSTHSPIPNPDGAPDDSPNDSGDANIDPKQYPLLSKTFAHPGNIVTNPDVANTLAILRTIATNKPAYHKELVELVRDAKTLDSAHLNLLVDSCYYTYASFETIQHAIKDLENKTDSDSRKQVAKLLHDQEIAWNLGSYTNTLIKLGLPKVSDLNFDNSMTLLNLLFPAGADEAFDAVLKLIPPIAFERELEFVDFAARKGANLAAAKIALDWFTQSSDHSVEGLISLTQHLRSDGKDRLLLGALTLLPPLTAEDVRALSGAAYYSGTELVFAGMKMITALRIEDITLLAKVVGGSNNDSLVKQGLARISVLSTDQLLALSDASYYDGQSLILTSTPKLTDFTVSNAIKLANGVSGSNKDALIKGFLTTLPGVSTTEIESLASACYYDGQSLILGNLAKITDLTAKNTVRISRNNVSGSNRDTLVKFFIDKTLLLSTSDLLMIAGATYYEGQSIVLQNISKISDLNAANTVTITQNALSGTYRDTFIKAFIGSVASLSTAEFTSLAEACYYEGQNVLVKSLPKTRDLSVANSLLVTTHLSGSNKDTYLLAAVDLVPDLTATNLLLMASHAYYAEKQVITKGKRRLGDL